MGCCGIIILLDTDVWLWWLHTPEQLFDRSENSPQCWQDFLNQESKKWLEQIQTDINYLAPGKELFGQLVDTIRGIVETQQAESNRTTQEILRQKEEADKRRNNSIYTFFTTFRVYLTQLQTAINRK